jgi:predicted lipoprotein with Yx(FWY)xxD motif
MRPTRTLVAAPLLALAVLPAGAAARPAGPLAGEPTVELQETAVGPVLANASTGLTLFRFTKDRKNKDVCMTISGCTGVWPPLTVSGTPVAGPGVDQSLLGTITLPGGAMQVTYKGRPLYGYVGESKPGEVSYVGAFEFGGIWYADNAKGRPVR